MSAPYGGEPQGGGRVVGPAPALGRLAWPAEPPDQPMLNRLLDRVAGPHDTAFGMDVPVHVALGVYGVAGGFALLVYFGLWNGVALLGLLATAVAALSTFALAGLVRNALAGTAEHIPVPAVLLAFAAVAAVAMATDEPVWQLLDLVSVAMGAVLVARRLGCLASGCCHGRPFTLGIRYRDGAALVDGLVGIRLFPLQLVESVWIGAVTVMGGAIVLAGLPPGVAAWWWLIGYGAGRFVLEFGRGEPRRSRLGPLTVGQWLILGVVIGRVVQETTGTPTWPAPQAGAVAALLVLLAYLTRSSWLALPTPPVRAVDVTPWQRVLTELEQAARAAGPDREVTRRMPSVQGRISMLIGEVDEERALYSYGLRDPAGTLEEQVAFAVAGLIAQRLPPHEILRADVCRAGVFHLWILVDRVGASAVTSDDPPRLTLYRAKAFARSARHAGQATAALVSEPEPRAWPPVPDAENPQPIGAQELHAQGDALGTALALQGRRTSASPLAGEDLRGR
jgi:Prolipoprotein diacylglyceryl transferase